MVLRNSGYRTSQTDQEFNFFQFQTQFQTQVQTQVQYTQYAIAGIEFEFEIEFYNSRSACEALRPKKEGSV